MNIIRQRRKELILYSIKGALGGYLGSKKYTDYRLKEYTSSGGFRPSAEQGQLNQEHDTMTNNDGENKTLRRSVQRTL